MLHSKELDTSNSKNKMRKAQSYIEAKQPSHEVGLWDDLDIPDENVDSDDLSSKVNFTPKNKSSKLIQDKGNIRPLDFLGFQILSEFSEEEAQQNEDKLDLKDSTFFPRASSPRLKVNTRKGFEKDEIVSGREELNRLDSSSLLERLFNKNVKTRSTPGVTIMAINPKSEKKVAVFIDAEIDSYSSISLQ